ncbi:MAG: metallophosphoesterase family protein [Promethearchaeia archaeon]
MRLCHISDFHVGSGDFVPEYLDNVINYINDYKPDLVVCTGDLVHKGRLAEYKEVIPYLDRIEPKMMVIPGNHEFKYSGIILFENMIGPRCSKLILNDLDAIVVGACSGRDGMSDGEIGDEQMLWLSKQFNKPLENRIIALHHHLISVPYSGRKFSICRDAGEVIEFAQLFEIDLVLMGHKHIPHAYVIGPTTFLYCGTSASTKVRAKESPSFNLIEIDKGDILVEIMDSVNLKKQLLLKKEDGEIEYVRPRKTRIEHIINSGVFKEHQFERI